MRKPWVDQKGHVWEQCSWCKKFVRNKPIFGSLHFCLTDEEKEALTSRKTSPKRTQYLEGKR